MGRTNPRSADSPPLRIGLVTAGAESLQDWQWRLLDRLSGDPSLDLCCHLVLAPGMPARRISPAATMILALDRALLGRTRPYGEQEMRGRLDALPQLAAAWRQERLMLDVLLNLGGEPAPDELLAAAAFGEWSPAAAACRAGHVDWSGFAAAHERAPVDRVEIVVRGTAWQQPFVVAAAEYSPKFSAARNAAYLHEKSVLLLHRALADLARRRSCNALWAAPEAAPPPGARAAFGYGWQLAGEAVRRGREQVLRRFGNDPNYWQLAVGKGSVESFEPAAAADLPRFSHTMADPFLFTYGDRQYLFYEAARGDERPAWISVARIDSGSVTPLGEALRQEYHLSFPFVFRRGEDIFMLPETQERNRLEIWRCVAFPSRWELHATALEGAYPADSILFEHRGSWWLMSNLSDHHSFQEHSSELYVFRVDGPELRRLEPHRMNPVVIGSTTARNAGNPIRSNGRLFRPSQVNANGIYGYGLNIMEVEELDLERYSERLVRRITPDFRPRVRGIHHVSFAGGYFVFDTFRSS